eukprot:CAMPEP_0118896162 /NCGR_PEP_ID=MMETSP1166-20130328/4165_1 /TAXON_ID=1104430 /ORGANISM="Chrysoreinhardia sp, Strain CCMP3193" /LENGTH=357 /DNA_ID=CAMNT_0006835215 /DNA_START=99 /DNA_END=1172 /DNA_ORIENTATION=+
MANLLAGAGGQFGSASSEPLVRFKAGKCESEPRGASLWVTPTARKGEVQLVKVDDLLHFQWRDRTTMAVDPGCDHMIFPGDAKFEKVETGRDAEDRVYVLQFSQQRGRRFFFWMQAKDDADDASNVAKVNTAMNGDDGGVAAGAAFSAAAAAAAPASGASDDAAAAAAASGGDGTLEFLQQLQQGGTSGGQLTLGALQSAMSNLGLPQQQQGASTAGASASAPLRLAEVASADDIEQSGILDDEAVVERLVRHLPESTRTREELAYLLRAPQFRQALTQLQNALASPENFASVLANFQLPATDGPAFAVDPVRAFLDAVLRAADDDRQRDDAEMTDAPPPPNNDDNNDAPAPPPEEE